MKKQKNIKKISIISIAIILLSIMIITTVLALSPSDSDFKMTFSQMGSTYNIFCDDESSHMLVNGKEVTWTYTRYDKKN